MVLRAVAMAAEGVPAEPAAVRYALSGNLCRCTGYEGIVAAVCQGLRQMRGEAG
jgi:carbon-monoxide dehydrogenase small subunit